MICVVDTSAWIEWLIRSATGERVAKVFPRRENQIVPTIVQLELAHWLARETTADAVTRVLADSEKCIVAPLDTRIALKAAALKREHRLATADAIVYATALTHHADLLTCDAHFEGLERVVYLAKTAR